MSGVSCCVGFVRNHVSNYFRGRSTMEKRNFDEPAQSSPVAQAGAADKVSSVYDPGWNDPPVLSYESTSGSIKKGILNKPKRIAFPLCLSQSPSALASSPSGNSNPGATTHLPPNSSSVPLLISGGVPPPPPPLHSGLPPVGKSDNSNAASTEDIADLDVSNKDLKTPKKENSLNNILAIFDKILSTVNESKDVADIKKRLQVMTLMWKSDKLDSKVQQQMYLLSEALEKGSTSDANEIHKSLVVNYTSQCSTWMAGVRKLVQYASSEKKADDDRHADRKLRVTSESDLPDIL